MWRLSEFGTIIWLLVWGVICMSRFVSQPGVCGGFGEPWTLETDHFSQLSLLYHDASWLPNSGKIVLAVSIVSTSVLLISMHSNLEHTCRVVASYKSTRDNRVCTRKWLYGAQQSYAHFRGALTDTAQPGMHGRVPVVPCPKPCCANYSNQYL